MIRVSHTRFRRELDLGREGSRFRAALVLTLAVVLSCADEPTPPPDPTPATVTVTPASVELASLGDTARLTAVVRDQFGDVMEAKVTWSSSAPEIAIVDAAGVLTAVANGVATITARVLAVSGSAAATVAQKAASVFVVPEAFRLIRRGTVRAFAEAADANGHTITDASFAWTSIDTAVAIVDESGLVTATGVGAASVTAASGEAESASEIAVVVPPPVRSVAMPSVPTNGGLRSGGGAWELPPDKVFTVTLTGTGNPGYDFVRWTEDSAALSTDSVYTMQLAGVHEISAHFSVNQERGRWGPGNTYTYYEFPDTGYESLAWTFLPAIDPPKSLREKDLLHYYAYNFNLLNSTPVVGRGYAGFQSDGHLEAGDTSRWGKVVNYAIWGSNKARSDGLVNSSNEECGCYQIMFQYKWVEGRKYRFELDEGPSGEESEGKWWGLWVTDLVTDSTTFVGEQRVPTKVGGRPATLWSPRTSAFGEDLHWWRSRSGAEKFVCSDFEASSLAIMDVTAGEDDDQPTRVSPSTSSGQVDVAENGYTTTLCYVTVFQDGSGNVQHNVGFWSEPPESVLEVESGQVRR